MYTGPYTVTRILFPANVIIQRFRRLRLFVVHVDKLKLATGAAKNESGQPNEERSTNQRNEPAEPALDGEPSQPGVKTWPSRVRRALYRLDNFCLYWGAIVWKIWESVAAPVMSNGRKDQKTMFQCNVAISTHEGVGHDTITCFPQGAQIHQDKTRVTVGWGAAA